MASYQNSSDEVIAWFFKGIPIVIGTQRLNSTVRLVGERHGEPVLICFVNLSEPRSGRKAQFLEAVAHNLDVMQQNL